MSPARANKPLPCFLAALCLFAATWLQAQEATISIGTISGQIDAEDAFLPFSAYLGERLPGRRFVIEGYDTIEALMAAVDGEALDFAFITPAAFVELSLDNDLRPLATITQPAGATSSPWLAGAVFTQATRNDISRLQDVRNQRVVALSELALGGWLSAVREWQDLGIDVPGDMGSLDFEFSYTAVIDAVCNGSADVGVIAAGIFSSLSENCAVPLKVLPAPASTRQVAYPLAHSTRLYPEVAFVMARPQDEGFVRELTLALLALEPGNAAAGSVNIGGFTAPLSYLEVQRLMQQLRIGPFSDPAQLTVTELLTDNIYVVTLILIILVLLISAGFLNAHNLSRRFSQSEHYRKLVFEGSHIPMVVLEPEHNTFIDMNPAAVRLYGYMTKEQLIGKTVDVVTARQQDIETSIEQAFIDTQRQVMNDGFANFEWRNIRPNGEEWIAQIHLMKFEASEGTLIQATLEDITEIKQQEEERRQLEQQLEFSQRMESIGRLAGGIAHDFNNLLTVINGYSEMLLLDTAGNTPLAKILQQIRKAGLRASELTHQLLTFSRRQVTRHVPVNLDSVIRDSADMIRSVLGEDIRLELRLRGIPGQVLSDPGQLQQVLLNLVVNAKDAMPSGGILKISTEDCFITPRTARTLKIKPGDYVRMTVTDTGIGMDQNIIKHIFEPFFTTKGDSGTGLGLSTVYGIVQQSLGTIQVTSKKGEGASFRVYLPETEAEELIRDEDRMQLAAVDEPYTILVVEDQDEVRDYVISVLQKAGYKALAARSGREALRLMEELGGYVHLLLTDVVMEGMSGGELAVQFGVLYPEVQVLFTSGYPEDEIARHGVQQGEHEFLAKPYLPRELLARVSHILKSCPLGSRVE